MQYKSETCYDYIIIGCGVLGTSTAYYLSKQSRSILVIDSAYESAASRDINKIVRFDYAEPFYMQLAREALDEWTSNPQLKNHVHQTGRVVLYEDQKDLEAIKENHRLIGLSVLEELGQPKFAQRCGGLLRNPNSWNATFNPHDAWVELPESIASMQAQAKARGVEFRDGFVKGFKLDSHGKCSGVETDSEEISCTVKVVVATGAWTEQLLGKDIAAGHSVQATGVCVVHMTPPKAEMDRFQILPIISYLGLGEILPPTADGIIKMTLVKSFTNIDSETDISTPVAIDQCGVPQELANEVDVFLDRVCPELSKSSKDFKFYWDGMTGSQDPVIDTLPNDVVLAIGGSYHMAKFLPVIGKHVVAKVNEQLSEPYNSRWSLRHSRIAARKNQPYLLPQRDLQRLAGED